MNNQSEPNSQSEELVLTPEESSSGSSKIPVLVTLVLILLAVIAGYYFYTNSKSSDLGRNISPNTNTPVVQQNTDQMPVGNWGSVKLPEDLMVYSSGTYSIKYPVNFQDFREEGDVLILSMIGPKQGMVTELSDGVSLRFKPLDLNVSIQQMAQAKIKESEQSEITEVIAGPEEVIINGYPGVKLTLKGLSEYELIFLQGNSSKVLEVSNITEDPGNLGYAAQVKQIMSSIEFE